jgi:multimeric flavodoxin WrbA
METIRLFGISGSPRLGSTDYVVNAALTYAKTRHKADINYFSCQKKTLNFCIHCDYCVKKKEGCVFTDDMDEIYALCDWADALIIGTPVYQGTLSGQTKVILDRCRAVVAKNPAFFKRKVGAAIAVGGDRSGGQELALQVLLNFYILNEMIPVGGGAFGANLGATFWSKDKGAQGAKADITGLKTLHKTVDHVIEVVREMR